MALYLGNQKVSLRSGQGPTFDYGFDSNGRLVFANKNATEINNFLNYDSSYSETLDLSKLSKMEKVAVNGTADRKMEGLKGLLVSPSAPFTGSSPQINASYTGLNKSALVSLFESAPYNVGYEKVGNPTIVDGVASGFSASDYLQCQELTIQAGVPYEIATAIITPSDDTQNGNSNSCGIIGARALHNGLLYTFSNHPNPGCINFYGWQDNAGSVDKAILFQLEHSTLYYVKYGYDGGRHAYVSVSQDKINWETKTRDYVPSSNTGVFYIGALKFFNSYFPGSIDLNETYVKVNGVPWFGPGATKNLVPGGTVVGSLTVTDGVASGFSSSKYIEYEKFTGYNNDFEFNVDFTTASSVQDVAGLVLGRDYLYGGIMIRNKKARFAGRTADGDTTFSVESGVTLTANTQHTVNAKREGNILTLTLYKNGILEDTSTGDLTGVTFSSNIASICIGRNAGGSFNGSINLNNTYIKSGSTYWYRGMVPQVKTCSIVGAMGTADLTQEDKNIILNKGWSLTVR